MKHDYERYSTRDIQDSLEKDRYEILTKLEYICKKNIKEDILTINYYKSLPVKYPAKLVDVEINKKTVTLEVHPIQAVVINTDQYTFIKTNFLRRTVLGIVEYLNLKKKIVILTDLVYVQLLSEKREAVRVVVDRKIPVNLIIYNENYRCFILDISTTGISVITDAKLPVELPDEMEMILPMISALEDEEANSSDKQIVVTRVRLVKRGRTKSGQSVLFFTFIDKTLIDLYFSKFILARQLEIKKELEQKASLLSDF